MYVTHMIVFLSTIFVHEYVVSEELYGEKKYGGRGIVLLDPVNHHNPNIDILMGVL